MKTIFVKYANYRKEEFRIKTSIVIENDVKKVVKSAVTNEAQAHINNIYSNYNLIKKHNDLIEVCPCCKQGNDIIFDYLDGYTFNDLFVNIIQNEQEKLIDFINHYKKIIIGNSENIIDFFYTNEFEEIFGKVEGLEGEMALKVSNYDIIPKNIINHDNKNYIIDYEWVFSFPIPLDFLIYRNLNVFYAENAPLISKYYSFEELVNIFGISIKNYFADININFLNYVCKFKNINKDLSEINNNYLKKSISLEEQQAYLYELEASVQSKQTYIGELEANLQDKQTYMDELEANIQSEQIYINELEGTIQRNIENINRLTDESESLIGEMNSLIKAIGLQHRKNGILQTIRNWKWSYYIFKSGKFNTDYYLSILGANYKTPHPRLVKYNSSKIKILKILSKGFNSPIRHYVWDGAFEGLNPTPYFDTIYYLKNNTDILINGMNPFYHYIRFGINEKRIGAIKPLSHTASSDYEIIKKSNLFDAEYYLINNIDVRDAGIDALTHFCSFGWMEHRNPNEKFDLKYYLEANEDVKNANINPLVHYIRFGQNEGRKTKNENIKSDKTIVFVSHAATRTGAPIVLLDLINWFNDYTEYNIKIILLNGGDLLKKFTGVTNTLILNGILDREKINGFIPYGSLIMLNTVASFKILDSLYENKGYKVISYIHELEKNLNMFPEELNMLVRKAEVILGASRAVTDNLLKNHSIKPRIIEPINAFIKPLGIMKTEQEKENFKRENNIPLDATIVVACGTAFFIKNPKGFISVAEKVIDKGINAYFVWIGDGEERVQCLELVNNKKLSDKINFIGAIDNTREYFSYCDMFLLPSIEDTFPLVCLEAADCKLPIVCFDDAGGMPEFVENDCGIVVPYLDYNAMANAVIKLCDKKLLETFGENAYKKVNSKHNVNKAGWKFKKIIDEEMNKKPLVSVIVPNYNYEYYLKQRLDSIYNQSFKDFEVILLDDYSSDNSRDVLEEYKEKYPEITTTYFNPQNTGNVFMQWKKGVELANGHYIWIAEADDSASNDFLKTTLLPCCHDKKIVLSYSNSNIVGPNDEYYNSYEKIKWLTDIDEIKWMNDYVVKGKYEIRSALAYRNTIPNVSAVVFKKEILLNTIDTVTGYRKAGDWLLYVEMLRYGNISYSSKKLNNHRRHPNTVTSKNMELTYIETFKIHKEVCDKYYLDMNIKNRMVELAKADYISMSNDENILNFNKLYTENDILQTKNKVKVALYMRGLNYGKGGAEMLLITKANMLSEIGHEVFIFNRTASNNELPFDLNPNVEYYTIGLNETLSAYFKKNDIPICIALGIGHDDSSTLRDLHDNGVKTAYAVHNCIEFFESETPGKSSHDISTQICDQLIVNMKAYANDYIERGIPSRKIRIIPNMITKRDTNENFAPYKRKYIFTAGRLVSQKQQHILIEAFVGVAKAFEDIDLLIAGEGVLRSELQELIDKKHLSERVKLIGIVDNLGDYYNGCEFFVLPSKFEGSPLVLFEAASFGKVSVVFREARPFQELLADEPCIIFVDKMQKDQLEETLIKLLSNKQYEKLRNEAIDLFEANEKSTVIKQWINLIDELHLN